ncbi:MAG: ABC transporter ATP-binding protein [Oscillospiraceae bacterium]|nr:ABC transporter ATP-binding protein [Oscillospiraceae bacterium]MDD4368012.1 ABC transporter ATP-binding protein [Oscillospiraceae bacterium]
MHLLEVNEMSIQFGGLKAVDDITFSVDKGEILGLIGPNGAGKTTIFNLLTSVYTPTSGDILLNGKSIVGNTTWQTVDSGMARTFQNIRLFKNLSALDNVRIGFHGLEHYSLAATLLRLPSYWRDEKALTQKALAILDIFGLKDIAGVQAQNLPYGQQRKLEICRALASNPQLLLLDEPAAGMNPTETQELMSMIRFVKEHFDLAIILIEHDMSLVMNICERLIVLDYGRIIARGLPEEIKQNQAVITAYLGNPLEEEA